MRCDIAAVTRDSVAHKLVGFCDAEFVNSFPTLADFVQSLGRKRSRIQESRFIIQRAQTSVQVITVLVYQLQLDYGKAEFLHRGSKPSHAAARGAETVRCPDLRMVRMPKKVAMAFEILSHKVQFYYFVSPLAEPLHIERHFSMARRMAHSAGDDEFTNFVVASDEDLVGRENHVFEIFDRVDGFHF